MALAALLPQHNAQSSEQTMPSSTRYCISLTLPHCAALSSSDHTGANVLCIEWSVTLCQAEGTCQMAAPANTIIANFPLTEFYTILTTLK